MPPGFDPIHGTQTRRSSVDEAVAPLADGINRSLEIRAADREPPRETPVGVEPTWAGLQPAACPSGSSVVGCESGDCRCPRQESNPVCDLHGSACESRRSEDIITSPVWYVVWARLRP